MGKFAKGQSGNPGGRKATTVNGVNVTELAREYGAEAILTLAEIMRDKGAPHAARAKATESLLDRGFGKSVQKNEVTGKDGEPFATVSTPDLEAKLALLGFTKKD